MLTYKKEFKLVQQELANEKFRKVALRALAVQKRAKIKPSVMNPVLLNDNVPRPPDQVYYITPPS